MPINPGGFANSREPTNLWSLNQPQNLWLCSPAIGMDHWQEAFRRSVSVLDIGKEVGDFDELVALTLGEGRFGAHQWDLGPTKRTYYLLKPILPRTLTRFARRFYGPRIEGDSRIHWPVDPRYVNLQWEMMRQLVSITGRTSIRYKSFWPDGLAFSLVLTHDIETAKGQAFVREVAALEEQAGFRSSFNFVLGKYPLDLGLMQELRERGFEVGCHGLKHDGKLYSSRHEFLRRAAQINASMAQMGMVGFRSPLTHRNPDWMQALQISYDASFFDTDPYEPIPGGTMSIWPYFLGHFVELPYTLVQDYTLTAVLAEKSPRVWLEKVDFLAEHHGMVLLNSHPDYLINEATMRIYNEFLQAMQQRAHYWRALPKDVARWWRMRAGEAWEFDGRKIPLSEFSSDREDFQ